MADLKHQILQTVQKFKNGDLLDCSIELFQTFGYNTTRQNRLPDNTLKGFKQTYIQAGNSFNEDKALGKEWKRIELLFQITADEMRETVPMFQPTVNRNDPASYLFFAIELSKTEYSRNQLSQIAREINKVFPMHTFILFKYGELISLSLIDRRPNKKVLDKDVMEQVTHVYNVSTAKPHSAHIQILYTFSLEAILKESKKKQLDSFKDLQMGWRKVLSTQILNKQFYLDYSLLSKKLIKTIFPKQIKSKLLAHQGVLNLLNRIMFIYFVQKKNWLLEDDAFMIHFWEDYKETKQKDQFHEQWINTIFFFAFNGRAWDNPKGIKHLTDKYQKVITDLPYLNGGLFEKNEECDSFVLKDEHFEEIFKFFEGYIFTITEDTPIDINLEINPELLGKMYEGMINATDLDDVDAEHGIIYTERPEINFMVRRSLVEVLDKKLNPDLTKRKYSREFLYHFIFDQPELKEEILKRYKPDVDALRGAISTLTACDVSCGSGSMLLGVIQAQMELIRSLDKFLKKPHTDLDDFNIKKQLISECIYGVDIKEWAVRIAELRLWLYMISEAKFSKKELTKSPLLPNLDFKLRKGNSLLQKFGNIDFTVDELLKNRKKSAGATKRLSDFIKKKKEYIVNQADSKTTYAKLKREEFDVFIHFIDELIIERDQQTRNQLKQKVEQGDFFAKPTPKQGNIFEEQIKSLKEEVEALKKLKVSIQKEGRLPFSYDIDFMEVFLTKEDSGFDLIIGNPPYVRQEQILPPEDGEYLEKLMKPENNTLKTKVNKAYKEELNAKVYKTYPFLSTTIKTKIDDKDRTIPVYGSKVAGRSDLYSYFQLLCPNYLNTKGTFCFIISNSWLDVDFGSFVQHFLLKHTNLISIYDCNVRSFDALVNTIIYIHGALINTDIKTTNYKLLKPSDNRTHFIMNKMSFVDAAYAPILLEQENSNKNTFREYFRLISLKQNELFDLGYDDDSKTYEGNKWGAKYLRAPEIYYKFLERSHEYIDILKNIGEVRFGIKTGANEFFYLDDESISKWKIESQFLLKVLKSPKDTNTINVTSLKTWLFVCDKDKNSLKGTNALKYIKWGEESEIVDGIETRSFHLRPSCSGRIRWYSSPIEKGNTFWGKELRERLAVFTSDTPISADCRLYLSTLSETQQAILNSTISIFIDEVLGRQLGGGGGPRSVMVYEVKNLVTLNAKKFKKSAQIDMAFSKLKNREILSLLDELGFLNTLPLREQYPKPLPDRKALDDIIFNEIGLSQEERNEVYWSVAELVKQRLDKAASR